MKDRFIRACRRESVDRTPVWFMRQAGRYMAEYRALREKHSLLELCRTPELAVEVTLQPIRAFGVDAAILFSDLLIPLEPMGIPFDFRAGEGPVIEAPVRAAADVAALRRFEPREELGMVLEAIRLLRRELRGAAHRLRRRAVHARLLRDRGRPLEQLRAHEGPDVRRSGDVAPAGRPPRRASWRDYLRAQVEAGAQAVQLFDSWVGALDEADYREFVLPHVRRIFDAVSRPRRPEDPLRHGHRAPARGAARGGRRRDRRRLADAARRGLGAALGDDVAVQGNLDPTLLFAPRERLLARVDDVPARAGGRPGHVFNLGHGILPGTPVEAVKAVVDHVHAATARRSS